MSEQNQLFLLDGTALAYRSYFAFIRSPLINSKGVNTSGVFGFTNTLIKIIKENNPDLIACAFDTSAPTFRHKTFLEYKATRQKMPDELAEQLPMIRQIVEAFNIPLIEVEGFEADDVMGTLAKQAEAKGIITFLVTGDKDFMQLVSDRVKMYSLSKGGRGNESLIVGPEGVVEKMGVKPEQVIDLLGLTGDSSDNVPGVPGIGPKTAKELIEIFGSLEALLNKADKIPRQRIREMVLSHKDQALLSKKLVTICTDVPLNLKISDLKISPFNREKVVSLFQELEFASLLTELPEHGEKADSVREYRTMTELKALDHLIAELTSASLFSLDLETTALDPISAEIIGFSFSWKEREAVYLPVTFPGADDSGDLFGSQGKERLATILEKMKPLLENPSIRKCGQNIKYDMLVLRRHGIDLQGIEFDTMVAAYLINPSARQFGIDALALEYLHMRKIPTQSLIGTGKNQISMAEVELEKVAEYACEDADVAFRLRSILSPQLIENQLDHLFREVEMPLVRVLTEMEDNGVAIDRALLEKMSTQMEKEIDRIKEEIYEIAGEQFNVNSTQQLGTILFERLKVHELLGKRRPRRTKTGYATDIRTLEFFSIHPLPRKMLDYRQLMKLHSTYVIALPKLINPVTNRIHTSFNQTVTATGRLSTSDPNLQNIPIRTELGKEIRRAFIAEQKDGVILSADYSQIELRIMAHLSGDETLLEAFKKGEDVHKRTAVEIFNIPESEITEEHRRQAKTINFGIMYGMGIYGLAQRLAISQEEAQQFITAYFARYPKVNAYIAQMIGDAHQNGFVTTLLNRRRYLPELKSENRNVREFGERTAINTPIQGTAADLIKVAMIRIAEHLRKEKWKSKMILQIHDELIFEVPKGELEALSDMVKREMEGAIKLSVPIKVDIGWGKNWYEAH
ncbi:DNA polymerase I [bacterium]|nr:DNA polymerase I [bacterium]RQV94365.1 MAG: DNA polymerase I [bacterium]